MKQFRKVMSLVLVVLLILPVGIVSAEKIETEPIMIEDDSTDAMINNLLDEYTQVSCREPVDTIRLALLQAQLEALGVEFLDYEEVCEQFPEVVQAMSTIAVDENAASPMAYPPDSNVNTWVTTRTTGTDSNGVTYNIQRLIASSSNPSSCLVSTGSKTCTYTNTSCNAGSTYLFTGTALSIGGSTLATSRRTIYNMYSAQITGLTSTSTVKPSIIHYSWTNYVSICFSFVRKADETDEFQELGLVSSRCNTTITTTLTGTAVIDGVNVSVNASPKSTTLGFAPSSYLNTNSEITGYKSGLTRALIDTIRLTGINGSYLGENVLPQPAHPLGVED